MAVEIVTQRRTPLVMGPNRVVDSMELGAVTTPSGVYFERYIDYSKWITAESAQLLVMTPIGNNIESLLEQEMIVSAAGIEDLDANGLVRKMVEFTVQFIPPESEFPTDMTTTVAVPTVRLSTPEGRAVVQGALNHAHDLLAAAWAGG